LFSTIGAASAAATPYLNNGSVEETQAPACWSIIDPPIQDVPQTAIAAFQQLPAQNQPASGDTPFWIGAIIAGVGANCGGGGSVLPEFILPAGVSVVNEPGYQAYWQSGPIGGNVVEQSTPIVLTPDPATPGGVFAGLSAGQNFTYTNGNEDLIAIPVRTTRELSSTGPPTQCVPTCPDDLQVLSQIADGGSPLTLEPWVGLFATSPSGNNGTPNPNPGGTPVIPPSSMTPGLALHAPATLTPGHARHGFTVQVTGAAKRKKVTFKLVLHGHVIARAVAVTNRHGLVTIRLKPVGHWARRLRAGAQLGLVVATGGKRAAQIIRLS
jgi:hypothetical protein